MRQMRFDRPERVGQRVRCEKVKGKCDKEKSEGRKKEGKAYLR